MFWVVPWHSRVGELLVSLNAGGTKQVFSPKQDKFVPPEQGTWRFIVSGDSRNCGDIVVPTIAAHSLTKYQPSFYWHLGDLRAIYKIDEDMAARRKIRRVPELQIVFERARGRTLSTTKLRLLAKRVFILASAIMR